MMLVWSQVAEPLTGILKGWRLGQKLDLRIKIQAASSQKSCSELVMHSLIHIRPVYCRRRASLAAENSTFSGIDECGGIEIPIVGFGWRLIYPEFRGTDDS